MNASLTFEYPAWLLLVCLVAAVGYSLLLYYKNPFIKDPSTRQKTAFKVLAILRGIAVFLICFFLLSPLIKTESTEKQKPVVVVLQDDSKSISNTFKNDDSTKLVTGLQDLADELNGSFNVKYYSFAQELNANPDHTFNGTLTNLSRSLTDIYSLYGSQNLAGVVLASDGLYNEGSNPYYTVQAHARYPVYTIALGDTTPQQDLKIDRLYKTDIVYLNDRFQIDLELLAQHMTANTAVTISEVNSEGKLVELDRQPVNFEEEGKIYESHFVLKADKTGMRHYRVSLLPVEGEFTTSNNYRDIFIDVLDSRQKVLILALSPHPDIAAIRDAALANNNYEVTVKYSSDPINYSPKDYDLIILHQLPGKQQSAQQFIDQAKKSRTALWYILGSLSDVSTFNKLQQTVQITQNGNSFNEATGQVNPSFSLFTGMDKLNSQVGQLPPLYVPFGNYKLGPGAKVLLNQKIGSVATDYPMLAFNERLGEKTAVLTGEGLWRWRLYDYNFNGNHDMFNELVTKTIQYLSVRQDKRRFKVRPIKNIFMENDGIEFTGELYNESYELINTPDVKVTIKDSEGKEFPYIMSKTLNAYKLVTGNFPQGIYNYTASTEVDGEKLSYDGQFTISEQNLEASTTVANHQLLYQMSNVSGGNFYSLDQINDVAGQILSSSNTKPIIYSSFKTQPVINIKWLFAIILSLLAAEWFIRKYMGGY